MILNNSADKRKVLVFGGSGFLGSHVADALSDAGYDVHVFDRFPSLWLRKDQKMIIGDILDTEFVEQAIANCYAVYNFAAIADLDEALTKPLETAKVNILGNVHILEACRKNDVTRYVYASTVYVNSREGGFYRCSKRAAEQYVEQYQHSYGLDYTILRYGSLYGPRSDEHNGLWRVVTKAIETGKISYNGSPEAMREYIHVVLTGQEPMRVMDLLKMLAEILGMSQNVEFVESDHPGHYIRTPYAYQPKLGRKYAPPLHVDLGQGLLELILEIQKDKNQI